VPKKTMAMTAAKTRIMNHFRCRLKKASAIRVTFRLAWPEFEGP
jgi:hypothetical protein